MTATFSPAARRWMLEQLLEGASCELLDDAGNPIGSSMPIESMRRRSRENVPVEKVPVPFLRRLFFLFSSCSPKRRYYTAVC
jgi:hypothetical protein